ncbi:MAG: Ig-like domain-containing protein [Gammaproteobacteria bacterium]
MTQTHTTGTKPTDPRTRSRWLGIPALVWFGALIAVVGIAVGQAGETSAGEAGPIVQHGPAQTLVLPKAARAHTRGASATLLPTGQWLLLGGTRTDGTKSIAAARLYDAEKRQVTALKASLLHARAYHTATLLADGRILVLGGVEREGRLVRAVEFFDPVAGSVEAAPDLGLMARARHRATLLADARVLFTGGAGEQGLAIDEAELFDPESGGVERFNARLDRARFKRLAALLPNHNVLVWGGIGTDGAPVEGAELYDPAVRQFLSYDAAAAAQALEAIKSPAPPTVIDSEPSDGALEVDGKALISVRFSKPLQVTSLSAKTIALVGPEGHVPVTITPTEGGLVVFVRPKEELLPSSAYAAIVQGATDRERQPLPFTAIGFKTRGFEPTDDDSTTDGPTDASGRPGRPGSGGSHDPTGDSPTATDPGDPTGQAATEATTAANKALIPAETEDGESFALGLEQPRPLAHGTPLARGRGGLARSPSAAPQTHRASARPHAPRQGRPACAGQTQRSRGRPGGHRPGRHGAAFER